MFLSIGYVNLFWSWIVMFVYFALTGSLITFHVLLLLSCITGETFLSIERYPLSCIVCLFNWISSNMSEDIKLSKQTRHEKGYVLIGREIPQKDIIKATTHWKVNKISNNANYTEFVSITYNKKWQSAKQGRLNVIGGLKQNINLRPKI